MHIFGQAGRGVTSSLLKSTVSSTTTDYTPEVSSRVGSDSTFLHSGIENADTQTDDGGDVSAMRRYDAFGNPVAAWGGWWGPFGYGGPYGYQTDPDHGLILLGHRYYESDTGRFLTRDPIKDGRNWYGYCGSAPLHSSDPSGLVDPRVRRIIDRVFGRHVADRYVHDGRFRGRVHERMGDNKIPGLLGNPDLSEEDVIEAVEDVLPEKGKSRSRKKRFINEVPMIKPAPSVAPQRRVQRPATQEIDWDKTLAVGGLLVGSALVLFFAPEFAPLLMPLYRRALAGG